MKRNDFKQTLEMCSIRKALGVFYCICCTENMFLFSPLDFRCQPHSREEFLRKTKARPRVSNRWPCAAKSSLVKSYSFPSRIVSLKALKIKQHFFFFSFLSKSSTDMTEKVLGKPKHWIYTE